MIWLLMILAKMGLNNYSNMKSNFLRINKINLKNKCSLKLMTVTVTRSYAHNFEKSTPKTAAYLSLWAKLVIVYVLKLSSMVWPAGQAYLGEFIFSCQISLRSGQITYSSFGEVHNALSLWHACSLHSHHLLNDRVFTHTDMIFVVIFWRTNQMTRIQDGHQKHTIPLR